MRGDHVFLKRILKADVGYLGLLIVLNLVFFGDVLFTGNTFFYRDIGSLHYPLKKLVVEAYSQGEWPLWNPYIQFGQPLLANPNAMAVYPTQILFHILPFEWAFDFNLVLHCMVGGIGAYCLGRALGLSTIAAFAAGVAYNFNGVVISLINLPLLSATAGLLPWLALCLRKVVQRPSVRNIACLSFLVALVLLVLEPLTCAAAVLFALPFGIYSWFTGSLRRGLHVIVGVLLIALVCGALLAAVQLLPTLELLGNSDREAGLDFGKAAFWSIHPVTLTQMLFPAVWEDSFSLSTFNRSWSDVFFEGREAYIVSSYWGLSCLILVLLGVFFSGNRSLTWLLVAVSLVAIVLALGKYTPVYLFLCESFPLLRFGRYPAKFLLTTSLSFALLTGLGLDQLAQLGRRVREQGGKKRLTAVILLITVLLGAAGLIAVDWTWEMAGFRVADGTVQLTYEGVPVNISQSSIRYAAQYLFVVVCGGTALVLLSSFAVRLRPAHVAYLAVALVFLDLASNHSINPVIQSGVYQRSPVAEWLLKQSPAARLSRIHHITPGETSYSIQGESDSQIWHFVFKTLAALPYTAAADHLQYSSFPPVDRLETSASQRIYQRLKRTDDIGDELQCLSRLNTCYLVAVGGVDRPDLALQLSFPLNTNRPLYVYRLKSCFPRAFLLNSEGVKSLDDYLAVGLLDNIATDASGADAAGVRILLYRPNRVELDIERATRSSLVLLDSYYPGWRVWVDEREGTIERVGEVFRGVAVPSGQSRVVFEYAPKSFRRGLAVTLFTLCGWIVVLAITQYRAYRLRRAKDADPIC